MSVEWVLFMRILYIMVLISISTDKYSFVFAIGKRVSIHLWYTGMYFDCICVIKVFILTGAWLDGYSLEVS